MTLSQRGVEGQFESPLPFTFFKAGNLIFLNVSILRQLQKVTFWRPPNGWNPMWVESHLGAILWVQSHLGGISWVQSRGCNPLGAIPCGCSPMGWNPIGWNSARVESHGWNSVGGIPFWWNTNGTVKSTISSCKVNYETPLKISFKYA